MNQLEAEQYLDQVSADLNRQTGRFVLGIFDAGVTVYSQQVRALNLVHALKMAGVMNGDARVAVLGGGVAGVTAAAAAHVLGAVVHLFEQRPILFHLQHGCETRWLHPHFYDWPARGSESPEAGLPFLTWRAGVASEVTEQLTRDWDAFFGQEQPALHEHLAATVTFRGALHLEWTAEDRAGRTDVGDSVFDVLILASGFGIEQGVNGMPTVSYWRNDSLGQPEPGTRGVRRFLVSGTGDGGLLDLLRLTVRGFRVDRVVDEFFKDEPELVERLRGIQSEPQVGEAWLYTQYNQLAHEGCFRELDSRLVKRRRHDTSVCLNGTRPFRESLSLAKASLLNTVLVHRAWAKGLFEFHEGRLIGVDDGASRLERTKESARVTISRLSEVLFRKKPGAGDARLPSCEKLIAPCRTEDPRGDGARANRELYHDVVIRHGTDRKGVLLSAGVKDVAGEADLRAAASTADSARRRWPGGWWAENAVPELLPTTGTKIESVTTATVTLASTFVSTLAEVLLDIRRQALAEDGVDLDLRITLHRVTEIQGEEWLQQIARYSGTRTSGAVGRLFPLGHLLIGLTAKHGLPILLPDRSAVKADLEAQFDLKPVDEAITAFMVCPFFCSSAGEGQVELTNRDDAAVQEVQDTPGGPEELALGTLEPAAVAADPDPGAADPPEADSPGAGTPRQVNLVLYMDSKSADFFSQAVVRTAYAACFGFVQSMDRLALDSEAEVRFITSSYKGHLVGPEDAQRAEDLAAVQKQEISQELLAELTFERVGHFDLSWATLSSGH